MTVFILPLSAAFVNIQTKTEKTQKKYSAMKNSDTPLQCITVIT